jgi:hypothetical protein
MAPTRPSKERAQCGAVVFLVVGGLVLAALLSFEVLVIRASDHGAAVEVSGAGTPTESVQSGMTGFLCSNQSQGNQAEVPLSPKP